MMNKYLVFCMGKESVVCARNPLVAIVQYMFMFGITGYQIGLVTDTTATVYHDNFHAKAVMI